MKDSKVILDYVQLLYYKFHQKNLNHTGSYIDSHVWIKNQKSIINPDNDVDNYFQYVATVTLNHEDIGKHPQRI